MYHQVVRFGEDVVQVFEQKEDFFWHDHVSVPGAHEVNVAVTVGLLQNRSRDVALRLRVL